MTEQSKIHFKQGSSNLPLTNTEGTLYFQTPGDNKRNKIFLDSDNTRHVVGGDPTGCVEYLEDTGSIDLGTIDNRPTKGVTLNPYDDPESNLYPYTDSTVVRRTNKVSGAIAGDTVEEAFAQLNKSIKIGETQKNINEGSSNLSWNCNEIGYRYEWTPAVKLGAWSRILYGNSNASNYGTSFLLSIVHMRSSVVYTNTFAITIGRLHATSVTKLGGSYYSDVNLGIKVSAGYQGYFAIDIFDNNNPTYETLYDTNGFIKADIRCTLIPMDMNESDLQLYKKIRTGADYGGGFVAGTDAGYNEATGDPDNMKVTFVKNFSANINFVGNMSGTLVADWNYDESVYKLPFHSYHNVSIDSEAIDEDASCMGWLCNDSSKSFRYRLRLGNINSSSRGGALELCSNHKKVLNLAYNDDNNNKDSVQYFVPSGSTAYIPHTLTTTLGSVTKPIYIDKGTLRECTGSFLPEVSSSNNGQFLRVVNGAWAPQTVEAAETLTYSAGVSASE